MARRTAFSIPATSYIENYYSSGGTSSSFNASTNQLYKTVTSGALGAGAFATALTVYGSGWAPVIFAYSNSATPTHTIRLQVNVDGITVFDATSDSIATVNPSISKRGVIAAGSFNVGANSYVVPGEPIRFNTLLEVKIASSQAGTDYVALCYEYQYTAS